MSTNPLLAKHSDGENDAPTGAKGAMSWWWLAPCALVVIAIPLLWRPLWNMAGSVSAPRTGSVVGTAGPTSRLGFTATHEGSDWRLLWNREALAKLEPLGAMLTISDGGVDRMQFLSSRDLAAGSVYYLPRTSDLTFNLKVTIANQPEIEEQIRVLGADKEVDGYAAPPRRIYPEPVRSGEGSRPAPPAGDGSATQYSSQRAAPEPTRKAFQPPPSPLVRVAKPDDAAAALPDVRLPAAHVPQLQTGVPVVPLPRQASAPAQAARPQTQSTAPPLTQAPPPPVVTSQRPETVVPRVVRIDPAPLRTVTASWPRNTPRVSPVDVRIRVQIDARGKVSNAIPLDRNTRNFVFIDSALAAARLWTFSPATENGNAVPSESVLTFKFTP